MIFSITYMMIIFLIFPTQLFEYKHLPKYDQIYIIEEPTYFTKYKFHKLKLAFHRASMKSYYDYIKKYTSIKYYEFKDNYMSDLKNNEIYFFNTIDYNLNKKIISSAKNVTMLETPEFITTHKDLEQYYNEHKDKKFTHDSSFYKWQRNRLQILTPISTLKKAGAASLKKALPKDPAAKDPLKNALPKDSSKTYALSYDHENRLAYSKTQKDIFNPRNINTKYIIEAKKYVNANFASNWGAMDNFIFPIDHIGAKKWLNDFIKIRLANFGKYEDAFHSKIKFGYHSVLSPLLNIGLLTDQDILDVLLDKHSIPINSLEGYIRQLIGWKQSMRYLYEFHITKFCERVSPRIIGVNFLKHNKKISKRFWDATTGIPPIDECIKKAQQYSYLHHIERLMVMGQFFLLTMIEPDAVYEWFISAVSIDSYEWVMVPNIYGMIMYADEGFMMSRPYFSSSSYIKKMNGGEFSKTTSTITLEDGNQYKWDTIWDALYYNLINTHYIKFKKIYATARNVYHWDNKSKSEQQKLIKLAKMYLNYI